MREILFRGQKVNNEWVYGNLTMIGEFPYISEAMGHENSVYKETVGQFTGLTDKNGTKIFEGDIIRGIFLYGQEIISECVFQDGAFGLKWKWAEGYTYNSFTGICNVEYEVIGNIHDNPDLLKEG